MKRLPKTGIGGKPFRQRDKFPVGVITQVGKLSGIQPLCRRRGEKDIIFKQRHHVESGLVELSFIGGD